MSSQRSSRRAPLPGFAHPEPRPLDPPPPEADSSSPPIPLPATDPESPAGAGVYGLPGVDRVIRSLGSVIREDRPPRTTTSTDEDPSWSIEAAGALVVGIVGLAFSAAGWIIRLRSGAQLRRPTKAQLREIAEPLAGILWRRVDLEKWGPDLADGIKATAATGAYVSEAPLIERATIDPGIPPGLTDPEGPA